MRIALNILPNVAERGNFMKANFKTTNKEVFTIEVNDHLPAPTAMADIISTIEDCVSAEELSARDDMLSTMVSTANKMFKECACNYAMMSDDVLRTLCNGVTYAKIYTTKDGDTITLNAGIAERKVKTGVVDKTPIYANRPDYVQYTDVIRALNSYNKELKKAGYKEGYTLKGGVNARQFDLLTVFTHNLSGKLSEKDMRIIERLGETFANFASDSNTKRLQGVQFFYDLFNAHTGDNYKAIGFVVNELKNDKRLATFDSQHYISTVPGEYTLLSVLISHYINTGKKVLEKTKAKSIADVSANNAVTESTVNPVDAMKESWIVDNMKEKGWTREQAEKVWAELEKAAN